MSHVSDIVARYLGPPSERNTAFIVGASVVTTFAVLTVSRLAFQGKKEKILRSPRATLLPKLSEAEREALRYPPDVLPGGRDVNSPVCLGLVPLVVLGIIATSGVLIGLQYGTTRVYEWGPEEGRKVLLVHGITTPCVAFTLQKLLAISN